MSGGKRDQGFKGAAHRQRHTVLDFFRDCLPETAELIHGALSTYSQTILQELFPHDLVQKRRAKMTEKGFTKKMYPRNGIEGTLSELVRGHGLRRAEIRGINRLRLSHYLMGTACNIKRYLNLKALR